MDISVDIIKQAFEGDIDAFEQIYKANSSFVYNVALKITRNCTDAEEVTQDVFMKVYHNLKYFQFRSAFKTWLYRVTVNMAINHYRKSIRETKDRVDYDSVIASVPAGQSTVEPVVQDDNEAMLNKLLGMLSLEYKVCLILREIRGLSYKEISAVLKIPVNTVRSRIKRARESLLGNARKGLIKDAL